VHELINAIRGHAQDLDAGQAVVRYGVITSVDPVRHVAKVLLQPEGVQSSWFEIGTPVPGWQLLPSVGAQALVVPREGDANNCVVICYAYSNPSPPPKVPNAIGSNKVVNTSTTPLSGTEMVLSKPGGAALRFCADGSVYVVGTVNIDGNLNVNGDIKSQGDVLARGNVSDLNGLHAGLSELRTDYNIHTHQVLNVQTGTQTLTTTQPSPQDI